MSTGENFSVEGTKEVLVELRGELEDLRKEARKKERLYEERISVLGERAAADEAQLQGHAEVVKHLNVLEEENEKLKEQVHSTTPAAVSKDELLDLQSSFGSLQSQFQKENKLHEQKVLSLETQIGADQAMLSSKDELIKVLRDREEKVESSSISRDTLLEVQDGFIKIKKELYEEEKMTAQKINSMPLQLSTEQAALVAKDKVISELRSQDHIVEELRAQNEAEVSEKSKETASEFKEMADQHERKKAELRLQLAAEEAKLASKDSAIAELEKQLKEIQNVAKDTQQQLGMEEEAKLASKDSAIAELEKQLKYLQNVANDTRQQLVAERANLAAETSALQTLQEKLKKNEQHESSAAAKIKEELLSYEVRHMVQETVLTSTCVQLAEAQNEVKNKEQQLMVDEAKIVDDVGQLSSTQKQLSDEKAKLASESGAAQALLETLKQYEDYEESTLVKLKQDSVSEVASKKSLEAKLISSESRVDTLQAKLADQLANVAPGDDSIAELREKHELELESCLRHETMLRMQEEQYEQQELQLQSYIIMKTAMTRSSYRVASEMEEQKQEMHSRQSSEIADLRKELKEKEAQLRMVEMHDKADEVAHKDEVDKLTEKLGDREAMQASFSDRLGARDTVLAQKEKHIKEISTELRQSDQALKEAKDELMVELRKHLQHEEELSKQKLALQTQSAITDLTNSEKDAIISEMLQKVVTHEELADNKTIMLQNQSLLVESQSDLLSELRDQLATKEELLRGKRSSTAAELQEELRSSQDALQSSQDLFDQQLALVRQESDAEKRRHNVTAELCIQMRDKQEMYQSEIAFLRRTPAAELQARDAEISQLENRLWTTEEISEQNIVAFNKEAASEERYCDELRRHLIREKDYTEMSVEVLHQELLSSEEVNIARRAELTSELRASESVLASKNGTIAELRKKLQEALKSERAKEPRTEAVEQAVCLLQTAVQETMFNMKYGATGQKNGQNKGDSLLSDSTVGSPKSAKEHAGHPMRSNVDRSLLASGGALVAELRQQLRDQKKESEDELAVLHGQQLMDEAALAEKDRIIRRLCNQQRDELSGVGPSLQSSLNASGGVHGLSVPSPLWGLMEDVVRPVKHSSGSPSPKEFRISTPPRRY